MFSINYLNLLYLLWVAGNPAKQCELEMEKILFLTFFSLQDDEGEDIKKDTGCIDDFWSLF